VHKVQKNIHIVECTRCLFWFSQNWNRNFVVFWWSPFGGKIQLWPRENNWRRREKINRRPQKQTQGRTIQKTTSIDRSGDDYDNTLRKNCIFLVLFPHGTVGRHKAAKSKLPMSCTMVFFFSDFLWRRTLLIYKSLSSRPPRKALFQGDLWIFSSINTHFFWFVREFWGIWRRDF